MARLSLKTLVRKNYAYGEFTYLVLLKRGTKRVISSMPNMGMVESMRDLLRTTCAGKYKLVYEQNARKKRIYTKLYLTNPMDLAMVKLVHGDKLHKIYKIKLADAAE